MVQQALVPKGSLLQCYNLVLFLKVSLMMRLKRHHYMCFRSMEGVTPSLPHH